MTRGEIPRAIRAWLAEQDGPRLRNDIATGVGKSPADVKQALARMVKEGLLTAEGGYRKAYSLGRQARDMRARSAEERVLARREQDRMRKRDRRGYRGPVAPKTASARSKLPEGFFAACEEAPVATCRETVAAWMARGNKPEVLPRGMVSQPLRFAGIAA
ncbi:MAG: hypothetical protein M3Q51_03465 [Pseudomonadota bacterium]|nr:hypothetical protein [Pseudomonadota bacterium]MDQ3160065.1 hypothetical protein [Pseudomonadota bacterium]